MSSVPVKVQGIDDATAISAGGGHTCVLHQTGNISCWGRNSTGPLGDGTRDDSSVPVKVQGIDDATAISAGGGHTCALHEGGTISCWGGWRGKSSVPVEIDGITDAIAISAGDYDSCALHEGGTISCWDREAESVPEKIDGISDATAIDAGSGGTVYGNSCALHQTGSISCWGPSFRSVPEEIDDVSDATAIAVGEDHSCALHQNGNISCWGNNRSAQLGNYAAEFESSMPVRVTGISDAAAITAGSEYSCTLHQTRNISCWGSNEDGRLGNGTNNYSSVPVKVQDIDDITAVNAGGGYSCVLHNGGNISCWGWNRYGQLGDGTGGTYHDYSPAPVKVVGIDDATAITTTWSNACALHQNGRISCWGDNRFGQLGNGTGGNEGDISSVLVKVKNIDDATAISTSWTNSCALHQNGTISCWGINLTAQLGDTEEYIYLVPVKVKGIQDATAISSSRNHSCALHQNGTISCWGGNDRGQLGDGTGGNEDNYSSVPVKVKDIDDATAISTGENHSCALHQTGSISCWGSNRYGQLGKGTRNDLEDHSSVPIKVMGIDDATAISTSWDHSCALRQTGNISCWGSNWAGQLGNGTGGDSDLTDYIPMPVKVASIEDAIAISAGGSHSCALHQNGTISCWGINLTALPDVDHPFRFVVGFGG